MMNMPQPVAKKCSMKLSKKLKDSAQLIDEQSMAAAAREVTGIKGTNDIGCLLIEHGKREVLHLLTVLWLPFLRKVEILDVEMISRKCTACVAKEPLHKENKEVYNKWKATQ